MTMMSDLPLVLVEKILSRVPISSLEAVRSTCKQWNSLSKDAVLCKAEAMHEQPFLGFMMMDYKLCSVSFDLREILNGEDFADPSIEVKEIVDLVNQVEISNVLHCDGLLLCVTRDNTSLVVCNPYLGQTRWIQPRSNYHMYDRYAIGYDSNRNHKILRFPDHHESYVNDRRFLEYEIYDLKSNSWRVLDITPGWYAQFNQPCGVSLNGNTYFLAQERIESKNHLLCFDFTLESFGQILPLPFDCYTEVSGTLSSVKEGKLGVFYQNMITCDLEIWVTTMIEPNAVSWSYFFRVDLGVLMERQDDLGFQLGFQFDECGSFFIDEEKKVAVLFYLDKYEDDKMAYITGENGYLKKVYLGGSDELFLDEDPYGRLLVSPNYVPSLVQISQGQVISRKRKQRSSYYRN